MSDEKKGIGLPFGITNVCGFELGASPSPASPPPEPQGDEEEARKWVAREYPDTHCEESRLAFLAGLRRGRELEREKHRMLPNWMLEKEISSLKQERDQQQAWAMEFQRKADALAKQLEEKKENGGDAHTLTAYLLAKKRIEELEKERDELRAGLRTVRPNMERIQREIDQCKRDYSMTHYPTIGHLFLERIDALLASRAEPAPSPRVEKKEE